MNISNRTLRGKLTFEKAVAIGYILTHRIEFEAGVMRANTYHGFLGLHAARCFNVMFVRSHPGDGAPRINEELVFGENIRDHEKRKFTRLTICRRATDADGRHIYTAGVVQRGMRCLVCGRGSTSVAAALREIPQVFPISFAKVGYAIEVGALGNGHHKKGIMSKGWICNESRSKHDQRDKSGEQEHGQFWEGN